MVGRILSLGIYDSPVQFTITVSYMKEKCIKIGEGTLITNERDTEKTDRQTETLRRQTGRQRH